MYWARNAYNPAFYGLTTKMVDTVESECISICKNVETAHNPRVAVAVSSSIRKLIKEEQKHASNKKVEGGDNNNRRESVESNDTGYASDSR